jgi:hypothetical protein
MPPRFQLEMSGGWLVVSWAGGVPWYSFRRLPMMQGDPAWGYLPDAGPKGPSSMGFYEPSYVTIPAWSGRVEPR